MATIVVVDDHAINRQFLVTLLGDGGHRVLEAADGAEALAIVRAEHADLVITDVLMPTMDGYEFIRRLRADPAIAQTRIIFCTAYYLESEARRLALACGVARVLSKPCDLEVVLHAVEATLTSAAAPAAPPAEFDREHQCLLTEQLSQQVNKLQAANLRLEALLGVSEQLATERDPARLLESGCQAARQIIGAQYAALGVLEQDGQTLRHCFTAGLEIETVVRLGIPPARQGILDMVLRERRPQRLRDLPGDPQTVGLPPAYPPIHSALTVPLVSPTRVHGWLCLTEKCGADEFSADDERLAAVLAGQLGRMYENGSLYHGLQRHTAQLEQEAVKRKQAEQERETLYQLAHDLARTSDMRTVGEHLFAQAKRLLRADYGALLLADASSTELRGVAAYGIGPDDFAQERVDFNEPAVVSLAFHKREVVVVTDYPQSPLVSERLRKKYHYVQEVWSVPLMSGEQTIGVFSVGYLTPQEASAEQLRFLRLLGDEAALALERIHLAEGLRESEERFERIASVTNDALWDWDVVTNTLWRSAGLQTLLGHPASEVRGGLAWWFERIHPEDREKIVAELNALLEGEGQWWSAEYRFRRADGSYAHIVARGYIMRDDRRQPVRMFGGLVDVTKHKQMEAALQEREAWLRCLFDSNIIGIFFVDLSSGAITDANDAFLQMTGYGREDLRAGKLRWEAMTPPEYRPLDEQGIEALRRSGACAPFEKEYLRHDGSRIPVVVGAALVEGSPQTCVVFALDITERKRAEEALRKERNFVSAVVDTADTLIIVVDSRGRLVRFNQACERLTGYSFDEVRNKYVWDLFILPEEKRAVMAVREKIHTGQFPNRHENYWVMKDGSHRLISWSNTALLDDSGQVEYGVGIGIDITEQRKAEQRQQAQFAITRILASASSLQEAASHLLQIFCQCLDWDLGELWIVDPDSQALHCESIWHVPSLEATAFVALARQRTFLLGQGLPGWVWARGEPVWIPDVTADAAFIRLRPATQAGLRTAVSFPIHSNNHVIAVIEFLSREICQYDEDLLAVLADIGSQIGHFVERRWAEEALRQLSGQLLRLQDQERRRLARELHDSTAQNLTAVAVNLAVVNTAAATLEPQARHFLEESLKLVQESVSEIRTLSYLLHPPLLEELGLVSALSWYGEGFTRRSGIQVHLDVPPELGRLPQDVELALFRIVQESLTNIQRHSASATASIRLARDPWQVVLTIADQGHGMPAGLQQRIRGADPGLGVGIAGMRERVRQLGGQLDIHSGNHGTTLTVTLPVAEGDA